MKKFFFRNKFIKYLTGIIIILFILASIPYYQTRIYSFQEPTPFVGDCVYNPYQYLKKNWIKANFHSHTFSFLGITNGRNTPEEMNERYRSLGYQINCLSNYNRVIESQMRGGLFFRAYEHGLNCTSTHQLVINRDKTFFFDFPFLQCRSHKQWIIDKEKNADDIIVLAHPSFKNSYSLTDMKYLVNYDFIEGVSPVAKSIQYWDQALSSGHAVWIMGNDDAHRISDGDNGVCWNMINCDSLYDKSDVLESLKKGACYATKGWLGQEMNRISSLKVIHGIYELELEKEADSIILISDWGRIVAVETNKNSIRYKMHPSNSYVRAEVFNTEPYNGYTKMFLNPVIRTKANTFEKHHNTAQINVFETVLFILILAIIQGLLIWLAYFVLIKRGRSHLKVPSKS